MGLGLMGTKIPIDIVLLTKNSVNPCLKECLESVYRECEVHHLIAVDGGSEDGTLGVLQGFSNLKLVDDTAGNRATSRQLGIDGVDTEWFVFIDSDVILTPGWWFKMLPVMHEGLTGMAWGYAINPSKGLTGQSYGLFPWSKFGPKEPRRYYSKSARGFTHDTLVRTKAVGGIRIPPDLLMFEDWYIRKYVESRGYKYVVNFDSTCVHRRGKSYHKGDYWFYHSMLARRHGYWNIRKLVGELGRAYRNVLLSIVSIRGIHLARREVKRIVFLVQGWEA